MPSHSCSFISPILYRMGSECPGPAKVVCICILKSSRDCMRNYVFRETSMCVTQRTFPLTLSGGNSVWAAGSIPQGTRELWVWGLHSHCHSHDRSPWLVPSWRMSLLCQSLLGQSLKILDTKMIDFLCFGLCCESLCIWSPRPPNWTLNIQPHLRWVGLLVIELNFDWESMDREKKQIL